jgi:hypothetical protein
VAVPVLAEVPSPVGSELCEAVMDRDPLALVVGTDECVAEPVGTDE